jgi:hypothetical protein
MSETVGSSRCVYVSRPWIQKLVDYVDRLGVAATTGAIGRLLTMSVE